MEPTDEERSSLRTMAELASWVPMSVEHSHSLFAYLGCEPDQPIRTVGYMDAGWYNHLLTLWRLPGELEPPPAVYSQAGVLGRTARFLCGMEVSVYAAPSRTPADLPAVADLQTQVSSLKRQLDDSQKSKPK
eukprot:5428721-Amphidinium_carterae.1